MLLVRIDPDPDRIRRRLNRMFDLSISPQDVIDGLQFERLLSASGPTEGEIRRPSDGKVPRRVAFISCVGSRDPEHHYALLLELSNAVPKRTGLLRAPGRVRLRIEVENDRLPLQIGELEGFPLVVS